MKIIFFPHAGGDKYAYLPYQPILELYGWEGVFYELPGHGDRYHEPLLQHIDQVMDDIWSVLSHEFTGEYILFGNSMGSLPAWLLLSRISEAGLREPVHFFGSSRKGPASYPVKTNGKELDHDAFWEMIREYGGAPDFIDNGEFRTLFEPMLRADFNVLESYSHTGRKAIPMPATLLFGKQDRYSENERNSWLEHFEETPSILLFEGGHFFVYEQPGEVCDTIARVLAGITK